ncbi:MAG: hypothetical protein HUU38_18565 [Anaerolineales bacterium]|jgi:hypothetical protein|nr:hypothetical protein [Anaerolineales bacterium]
MNLLLNLLAFVLGAFIVFYTLNAAIRSFVLPRGDNVWLTRIIFQKIWRLYELRIKWSKTEEARESILAMYTPVTLLIIPVVWLALVTLGFMGMFWAVGVRPLYQAFVLSGSSLLTLGFAPVATLTQTLLTFLEATIGLILIALLIAYLPTMYAAFSRRENLVAKLEIYAGSPPTAVEIIARMHRLKGVEYLQELYTQWETWFAEIEEAQTTFGPLNFFRSPQPHRSWVTSAGAVLDSAALLLSTLEMPREPRAALCIRAGYLALRRIADFFGFAYNDIPLYGSPIQVTRAEFDAACAQLEAQGLALKPDRDQAYQDFAGWRINYEDVLLAIASITLAPSAPWSSDRAKLLPTKQ